MARNTGRAGTGKQNKAERVAAEVAKAVEAGKAWDFPTVDFSDPNRPPTCLEVDFPIVPINQIAAIEGNAGKPIYQMSKWWARRRSSVFRAMLLATAIKAPEDRGEAAKVVWKSYYGNHARKGAFKHLHVADIFMGGGTTLVEGSRLGMQMFGNDLNPVAWFVVKTELAQVQRKEVEALLKDIEVYVKPQIMPFYACRGPGGEKGIWIDVATGKAMGKDFDPLALKPEQRVAYRYEGPEIIYVFWSKHGPCQVTDCRHITPLMSTPDVAEKILTVKARSVTCKKCDTNFDAEDCEARMAPDVPLTITDDRPFATLDSAGGITCPSCGEHFTPKAGIATKSKKVGLTLLMHPDWMFGCGPMDANGNPLGGSATDDVDATVRWFKARSTTLKLLEVRSAVIKKGSKLAIDLPDEVTCPVTKKTVYTDSRGGTQAFRINKKDGKRSYRRSSFACGANGHEHDMLDAVKASKKAGPVAPYVVQAYSPKLAAGTAAYGGRYFLPADDTAQLEAAWREWNERKDGDLAAYWPRSTVPYGFMTAIANADIRKEHGFTHWWTMFNPRQLLVNAMLLKAINEVGGEKHRWETREYVLAAYQQYLRNQNMFCFWHRSHDHFAPMLSNNNFHSKDTAIEVGAMAPVGYGPWRSCISSLIETVEWRERPWDLISNERVAAEHPTLEGDLSGMSTKAYPDDPVESPAALACGSATELTGLRPASYDLVVTDPPFGGLLHYSELSDFFYVWLRLVLKQRYPDLFTAEYTPKTLEVVSNTARNGDDADAYYQRLLTESWREAHRVLKPGGMLAFTFHHSEDAPWVQVLESLFDAGFYLECVYPIRSDEIKGEGEFGSKSIEFDIIHVCRKRLTEPTPISWPKLRRSVLQDVRELKGILELHRKQGLQEGDMQVIKRGKALEYFSRHYDKVFKEKDIKMNVLEALVGINQLLDEEADSSKEHPPVNAEPFTRMLLRLFDSKRSLDQDQLQKSMRGTGSAPADLVARGWVMQEDKAFHLISPLEIALGWVGKQRKGIKSDYDQAMLLIGACFENSGINAGDTLNNANFEPHFALGDLLVWHKTHAASAEIRNAAILASQLFKTWEAKNQSKVKLVSMFDKLGDVEA